MACMIIIFMHFLMLVGVFIRLIRSRTLMQGMSYITNMYLKQDTLSTRDVYIMTVTGKATDYSAVC